ETVFRDCKRLLPCLTGAEPPMEIEGGLPLVKPATWADYFAMHYSPMTPKGYNPDDMAVYVRGDYPISQGVRPRLQPPYRPDRQPLERLVPVIREKRIEPVFVVMPFHDSFFAEPFHPGIRESLADAVEDVATSANVLLLTVPFDTTDAADYWDAHH